MNYEPIPLLLEQPKAVRLAVHQIINGQMGEVNRWTVRMHYFNMRFILLQMGILTEEIDHHLSLMKESAEDSL